MTAERQRMTAEWPRMTPEWGRNGAGMAPEWAFRIAARMTFSGFLVAESPKKRMEDPFVL